MRADSGLALTELKADGGASVMDLLLQTQADLLGVPVRRPRVLETTALGAAYLAGLGEGVWGSRDEVAAHWKLDREFLPSREDAEARYARWRRALDRARGWARP
jgi:glycerol kinase